MYVDNKTVSIFKRITTVVVDNRRGSFVVDNSFFQVFDAVVDYYSAYYS